MPANQAPVTAGADAPQVVRREARSPGRDPQSAPGMVHQRVVDRATAALPLNGGRPGEGNSPGLPAPECTRNNVRRPRQLSWCPSLPCSQTGRTPGSVARRRLPSLRVARIRGGGGTRHLQGPGRRFDDQFFASGDPICHTYSSGVAIATLLPNSQGFLSSACPGRKFEILTS
jgi:hypothetical protein